MLNLQGKDNTCSNFDFYLNSDMMPINQLPVYQLLCLIHKFLCNRHELLWAFINYFTLNYTVHDCATRANSRFHLMSIQSAFGHRMIRFKVCLAWNSLSLSLTDISCFNGFKNKLKLFLVSYCRKAHYCMFVLEVLYFICTIAHFSNWLCSECLKWS